MHPKGDSHAGTMTEDLLELTDWLARTRVTRGDGEHRSLLEGDLQLLEATFTPLWSTPGTSRASRGARPTSRIASGSPICSGTVCCGAASCPNDPKGLRELGRYRTTLVRERSAEVSRLQKTLEEPT